MIYKDTPLNNTFNEFTFKYFSLISIRSEQKSKICSSERGSSQEKQKGGSSPFNKNKWVTWDGSHAVSQFWSNLVSFIFGIFIPLTLPELKNVVIQTRFEVRKGDEFIRDIAIKGILSSRICCRITSDANMAGNPDKNNLPFLLD